LKRSYILSPGKVDADKNVHAGILSKIHPVYAMILSFFSNPITKEEAILQVSDFLEISEEEAENLISSFIETDEISYSEYGGIKNIFPRNMIIAEDEAFTDPVQYTPLQFVYDELDLKRERFFMAPKGIVFMVNNVCVTDCAYCYADKSVVRKPMPFERIKELIKNAFDLKIMSFDIVGGEFFLYKEWKNLLDELIKYDYKPVLISTKVPLTEKEISIMSDYNISIQISLDSLDRQELVHILNVKNDYLEKIKSTIELLEQYNIKYQIATVLTQYNAKIETLEQIYDFLSDKKNITRWEVRVGFKSLYSRDNFEKIRLSKEDVQRIDHWINEIMQKTDLHILWSPNESNKYFNCEGGSRNFKGARCSANYSHMVILPDGKVTICEQLYWNPRFIIGDVSKQSIEEVWNSPRALELAFPKREQFRDESVCKECAIFDDCFSYPNKCYAEVLKGYGDENWDYPDPRCAKAPQFINELQAV